LKNLQRFQCLPISIHISPSNENTESTALFYIVASTSAKTPGVVAQAALCVVSF